MVAHICIPHTQGGRTDEDLRSVWATQEDPGFQRETPSQLDIYGERQEVQQTNSHLESNSSWGTYLGCPQWRPPLCMPEGIHSAGHSRKKWLPREKENLCSADVTTACSAQPCSPQPIRPLAPGHWSWRIFSGHEDVVSICGRAGSTIILPSHINTGYSYLISKIDATKQKSLLFYKTYNNKLTEMAINYCILLDQWCYQL